MLASFCEPANPAWDTLLTAFNALVTRFGADVSIGRRLAILMRRAGLVDVEAEVHTQLARPGSQRRGQLLSLIASIRTPLLSSGAFTDQELSSLIAELRKHLDDPATVVMGGLVLQAWGRKPPE